MTRVWLFDLDNTLHNASHAAFGGINEGMTAYIVEELGVSVLEANALRLTYLLRYGATLLGLVRHHGIKAAHFLHHTHLLPGLEGRVHGHPHDFDAVARLPGRKFVLTNAPRAYVERVLGALGVGMLFDGVISIEDMVMFGHLRPKPDTRMLKRIAVRLGVGTLHFGRGHAGPPEGGAKHRHDHGVDAALDAAGRETRGFGGESWCLPAPQARIRVCKNLLAPTVAQ
jgi:pyrimidine 5'-nucleotidase